MFLNILEQTSNNGSGLSDLKGSKLISRKIILMLESFTRIFTSFTVRKRNLSVSWGTISEFEICQVTFFSTGEIHFSSTPFFKKEREILLMFETELVTSNQGFFPFSVSLWWSVMFLNIFAQTSIMEAD